MLNSTEEYQYISRVSEILRYGDVKKENRNGETLEIIGTNMKFDLSNNTLPLLTTKFVSWRTVLKELLFFIRGETNNEKLNDQGVHIWDANTTREFLDSRNLNDYRVGQLGPCYGAQWRDFNGKFDPNDTQPLLERENRNDQLQYVIDQLKDEKLKFSRRLVVSAWNPQQIDQMVLPPCHVMYQFMVSSNNKLHCIMTQRSADMGLGIPYNIASYALLTHLVAHHCGLKPGTLTINIGSAHIYESHIEPLKEQVKREPKVFPKIIIKQKRDKIEDYTLDDFDVIDYQHYGSIKMTMVA